MRFLQELAGRVEEAAQAGGKFAEALVRTAGVAVSGALAFVDREIGFAEQAAKKRRGRDEGTRKKD
jgi:orotate phosphoribosyltransferase